MKALLRTACVLALTALVAVGAGADKYPPAPTGGYSGWVMDTIATTGTVLDTVWAPSGYRIARFDLYSNLGEPAADVRESLWVKFTVSDTASPTSCTDSIMLITAAEAVGVGEGGAPQGMAYRFPVSCVRIELAGTQASGATESAHWAYVAYLVTSTGDGHGGVSWP